MDYMMQRFSCPVTQIRWDHTVDVLIPDRWIGRKLVFSFSNHGQVKKKKKEKKNWEKRRLALSLMSKKLYMVAHLLIYLLKTYLLSTSLHVTHFLAWNLWMKQTNIPAFMIIVTYSMYHVNDVGFPMVQNLVGTERQKNTWFLTTCK